MTAVQGWTWTRPSAGRLRLIDVAGNAAGLTKRVRSWADQNGVDCPTFGKVPGRVMEAYTAAQASAR